ncbi:glycoside hydrolase family 31 protein [Paenibacillus sp. HN-1]|uniref:glycoside hydrolase family 31 protein n=1 Tax=Paenibacillus TaxID=44249 RepID=UPI001CA822B3|nr:MULTISPECIES: glycoside hydrolase family 31 protein [Paenibacillus]MBY9077149.1 glycoside hydrolase family 31 protein [Paenibacillus sp. CGMCC 1.18879]MBY9087396.1 glycoside hydrolase family 31 protein [Paenibacillus sinensis]
MNFCMEGNRLVGRSGAETLWIEPWGENSLRVRITKEAAMDPNDWALTDIPKETSAKISIEEVELIEPWIPETDRERYVKKLRTASITSGEITAYVNAEGWLSFRGSDGEILLEEYWRDRNRIDRYCAPLRIEGRELKPLTGSSDYQLTLRFEGYEGEKIFGLGQYQEGILDKKGATLELAHRNSQSSVPFMLSSRGYGLLWNNPAIGTVTFGTNRTEWTAASTKKLDYFITAGRTPAQIEEQYANAVGKVPMMPEYGLGFWQCKLRYRTQEELLGVAREYKRRGIPLDVIVVDFFHWTKQGDFKFEPRDWPDPDAMIAELKEMGTELMVSVWPTIDSRSENYGPMAEEGYLISADRGMNINMNWMGETVFFDATHPGAREYVWQASKKNYYDKGVRLFWLDEAEPEYGPYDFDLYRYYQGPALQCTNIYPREYAKGYYEGLAAEGQEGVCNLVRAAWAGSQRYGALIWSGDISSTFRAMREQLQIGLNMGIAGIPWWTTDIGGFLGGYVKDPDFQELLLRWFAFGVFTPVFRLHGERVPHIEPEQAVIDGVAQMMTGSDNEIWSYGDENYEIMKDFIFMRERLRPYVRACMADAHEKGTPVMRTMFYEFPEDDACWTADSQYMFGPDILVAPVFELGQRSREVYLPKGQTWKSAKTGEVLEGGRTVLVEAPVNEIPLFIRAGKELPIY